MNGSEVSTIHQARDAKTSKDNNGNFQLDSMSMFDAPRETASATSFAELPISPSTALDLMTTKGDFQEQSTDDRNLREHENDTLGALGQNSGTKRKQHSVTHTSRMPAACSLDTVPNKPAGRQRKHDDSSFEITQEQNLSRTLKQRRTNRQRATAKGHDLENELVVLCGRLMRRGGAKWVTGDFHTISSLNGLQLI